MLVGKAWTILLERSLGLMQRSMQWNVWLTWRTLEHDGTGEVAPLQHVQGYFPLIVLPDVAPRAHKRKDKHLLAVLRKIVVTGDSIW